MTSLPGYSGTPLVRKLGYKDGFVVHLINVPANYLELVQPVPENVHFSDSATQADLVHLFTNETAELERTLPQLLDQIKRDGMIWVSWPKRASNVLSDISEDRIRETALPLGLVDVKVCAVDKTWSGLKLVIRKEHR
ncbi:MAG: DUF3052 family protein [Rubricoccaceae bacterium]|nr:DUF3052 family protein [Rubricoccaceae bacterium]